MTTLTAKIAELAQPIFTAYKDANRIEHGPADKLAQPLIEELVRQGHIRASSAHIEWAGLLEHGVIHVCDYGLGNACAWWVQVDPDGSVTSL
jgi:hypothetical protein